MLGDIITGCEDYKIRTFTRDFGRREEGQGYKDYEDECKAAALGNNIDMDSLPHIEQLKGTKGKKDGEVKVFKNGMQAEAYVWKGETQKWEKIGEDINSTGNKQVNNKYY